MIHDDNTLDVEFIDVDGSARILDTPTDGASFVAVWHQDVVYQGNELLFHSDGPWVLSTGRIYEVAKFLHNKQLEAKEMYGKYYCPTYVVLEDGLRLNDEREALLSEHINDMRTEHNQTRIEEIAELKRLKLKYPKA